MFESIILAGVLNNVSTSWEDPSVLGYFGTYGNVGSVEYTDAESYSGNYSLTITEDPISGTPQVYAAYVTGLSEGDTVTASAWMLGLDGDDDGDSAKGRLWGHYFDGSDLGSYQGSASGPSSYAGEDATWSDTDHTWTIAAGQTALIIEVRIYSYSGGDAQIWVDDLTVSSSNADADIFVGGVAIPAPGALALLGLAGLGRRRRNG
ncbi:MAG TPA: hypothetical protein DEQ73_02820 [Phycisphaerales bacterium]|nr:hypothetical protein [Phycisphaerales bacterium]